MLHVSRAHLGAPLGIAEEEHVPPMNARTAAEVTGKDRSTILRAIAHGRLSAAKNEHGQYLIDPAELERVYGSLRIPPSDGEAVPEDTYAGEAVLRRRDQTLARDA